MRKKSKAALHSRVHLLEKRFWDENDIGASPNEVYRGWKDQLVKKGRPQEQRHETLLNELNSLICALELIDESTKEKLEVLSALVTSVLSSNSKVETFRSNENKIYGAINGGIHDAEIMHGRLRDQSQSLSACLEDQNCSNEDKALSIMSKVINNQDAHQLLKDLQDDNFGQLQCLPELMQLSLGDLPKEIRRLLFIS